MKKLLLASVLVLASAASQAASIFSDNFDSYAAGIGAIPTGWQVSGGTIDIIGNGYYDYLPGSGKYIDLDGSTGDAGVLSHDLSLIAGQLYELSFDLAGSQVDSALDFVAVSFGATAGIYTLPMIAGWNHYALNFTPSSSATYFMTFSNISGTGRSNNMGMLLDNVNVAAVPEPETYAMMLAGLGIVGFMARRRRSA